MDNVVYKTRITTIWILVVTTLILIGWDIYMFLVPDYHDTISEVVIETAKKHPILPFSLGVVMGHFFWPQVEKINK